MGELTSVFGHIRKMAAGGSVNRNGVRYLHCSWPGISRSFFQVRLRHTGSSLKRSRRGCVCRMQAPTAPVTVSPRPVPPTTEEGIRVSKCLFDLFWLFWVGGWIARALEWLLPFDSSGNICHTDFCGHPMGKECCESVSNGPRSVHPCHSV